ncbi:AmmeMemoRadiSam system protein B [Rhodobacteraceae bacterium CCMM004]|nr:AmmeMemoRadiSam system protein B [Rhodobacteraceae bacterium CCMM004]
MRAAVLALALTTGAAAAECPEGAAPFPPFYRDVSLFETALEGAADKGPAPDPVAGVIVPHHLEVPDLIAAGLVRASADSPRRILVLFPDHFFAAEAPLSTSARGFDTVLGPVPGDPAAAALIAAGEMAEACWFHPEHGVRAVLPFLARLFPGVPVLPVGIALGSDRADWTTGVEALAPLAGPGTLIVQATDFSHYLPHHVARQRDQQVLNLLAASDREGMAQLRQPDHVDSVGALWMAATLAARRGAAPVVLASRNLAEGQARPLAETTSYLVALFQGPGADPGPPLAPGDGAVMVGGDVFLGRAWPRLMSDELVVRRVAAAATGATRGLPLIANLEGVLLPHPPSTLAPLVLAMPTDLLTEWAGRLNLVAVSLANNHARDVGESGLAETRAALAAAGVAHAEQGGRLEVPGVTLVTLTDLDGRSVPARGLIDDALLDRTVPRDAARPTVALVHWGREGQAAPGPRERALAEALRRRGVAAVIGAHPHVASATPEALAGGDTLLIYSLGNFLFDQGPETSSGALAEIRSFAQGTVFVRQVPLTHLYAVARGENGLAAGVGGR